MRERNTLREDERVWRKLGDELFIKCGRDARRRLISSQDTSAVILWSLWAEEEGSG
jgi:hypothetical protein